MTTKKKMTAKKTAPRPSYHPNKKIESMPARAPAYQPNKKTQSPREAKKMSDQEKDQAATIEALKQNIADLKQEVKACGKAYDELAEKHRRLERELEAAAEADEAGGERVEAITARRRYVRGILPGNKYIRIDTSNNTHEEITQEEWNEIPAGER